MNDKGHTMLKNPAFYCNSELCTGCRTCMIACKDKHDASPGVQFRRVIEHCGGGFTPTGKGAYTHDVFAWYISLSCNHCEQAPCVQNCPTGAMHRDENGIVSIEQSLCTGCRNCETHCPYAAPQFDAACGKMAKCDFCKDYLEENTAPACVAACPCRALDFGEFENLKARYGEFAPIEPLPAPELTRPHFLCAPNRKARHPSATLPAKEQDSAKQ